MKEREGGGKGKFVTSEDTMLQEVPSFLQQVLFVQRTLKVCIAPTLQEWESEGKKGR